MRRHLILAAALAAVVLGHARAETVKLGIQKLEGQGPVFIAQEKGYFRDQGLDVDITYFTAAQPIAVGIVSGALGMVGSPAWTGIVARCNGSIPGDGPNAASGGGR